MEKYKGMRTYQDIDGWFSENSVVAYNFLASRHFGGNFAEIGTWKGRSFCSVMPMLLRNGYKNIYAIDTFAGSAEHLNGVHHEALTHSIYDQFIDNLVECGFDNRCEVIQMSSVDASTLFENEYFDMIFIDADHTYEAFCADYDTWYPKLKPGGTICGHDVTDLRIQKALVERLGYAWYNYADEIWSNRTP